MNRLLTPQAQRRAQAVGAAVRLGCDLCGKSPALLTKASLQINGETLELRALDGGGDALISDQTRKRAETVAAALKRYLKVVG